MTPLPVKLPLPQLMIFCTFTLMILSPTWPGRSELQDGAQLLAGVKSQHALEVNRTTQCTAGEIW